MRAFSNAWSLPVTDKDGGYTTRSAISENSMLHANLRLMALCFIEVESWPIEVLYIAGIRIFDLFCSCDLDFDPTTFIYKLDLYSPK